MGTSRRLSGAAAVLCALLLVATLAGCSASPAPRAEPSATKSADAGESTGGAPAATPTPGMVAGGSATANKDYFDRVSTTLFASAASADGKTIIDTLVAAGFDKASMQVTPDTTSNGGAVDSILFSVKLGGQCLLGQRGPAGFTSAVQPALPDGSCLVGKTRPIDW
jgi:hypothetical protein